jgi:hypothetical protein
MHQDLSVFMTLDILGHPAALNPVHLSMQHKISASLFISPHRIGFLGSILSLDAYGSSSFYDLSLLSSIIIYS